MDVASIALKKRQAFTRYESEVRGEQRDEYPQVFTWIEVVHVVEGPGRQRGRRSDAGWSCRPRSTARSARCIAPARPRSITATGSGTGPEPFDVSGEVVVTGPYLRPDIVPTEAGRPPEAGAGGRGRLADAPASSGPMIA